MKRNYLTLLVLLSCIFLSAQAQPQQRWSETTAKAFINRFPDPDVIHWGRETNSFSWQAGYDMFAFEIMWRLTGDESFLQYVKDFVDKNVDQDGNVRQFKPDALDNFLPGYSCLMMYEITGEERYRKAAETIRKGFDSYPRFDNGMFWHSASINQVWVDGVFMGQAFLARYAKVLGHPEDFAEVVRQMSGIARLCGRPDGLFYHGWDESGHSSEVWSEGLGWLAVLWADIFDYLPEDIDGYDGLMQVLTDLCAGLKASQDKATGMWCQVVDKPGEIGNWNETSGTGMFLYLLQKAVLDGYIPAEEYQATIDSAYKGLTSKAVRNADGFVNLKDCSSIGIQKDYHAYVTQPHEISTFAAYGSFILGTGLYENRDAYHGWKANAPDRSLEHYPSYAYAGEWDTRNPDRQVLRIISDGKVQFEYTLPLYGEDGRILEFDDVRVLPDGNVVFAAMSMLGIVNRQGELIWKYICPEGTESHSCQPYAKDQVYFALNGVPGKIIIWDTKKDRMVKEIIVPTDNTGTHGQFRHVRLTREGNFVTALMKEKEILEISPKGKVLKRIPGHFAWHVDKLPNGNYLLGGDGERYVREVNGKGETVWSVTQSDVLFPLYNLQTATRLSNGNTLITSWVAGQPEEKWKGSVQFFEITTDKKVVWQVSSWESPDLGPCTYLDIISEPAQFRGMKE